MTSDNNDFPLYPYQEAWNDPIYLPTSYADQSYLNATTFDSFQTQQPYAQPGQADFTFNTQSFQQVKNHLRPQSPSYSPSNSASHSFDYQNPLILSSTSDSGASVQSTISSAMGSPSVQPQPPNDWNQQQSMSILQPGIVHHDSLAQDLFATTGFDLEPNLVTDKGCVGESNNVSSSQRSRKVSPSNLKSPLHPTQAVQDSENMSWCLLRTDTAPSNAQHDIHVSSTLVPQLSSTGSIETASPNGNLFRSPTTPASATSPVLERVKGKRQTSTSSSTPKTMRGSSPLAVSMSYDESDLPPRPQAPLPTFSSPFFSQSNGCFVPPLESSCPSSISRISFSLTIL